MPFSSPLTRREISSILIIIICIPWTLHIVYYICTTHIQPHPRILRIASTLALTTFPSLVHSCGPAAFQQLPPPHFLSSGFDWSGVQSPEGSRICGVASACRYGYAQQLGRPFAGRARHKTGWLEAERCLFRRFCFATTSSSCTSFSSPPCSCVCRPSSWTAYPPAVDVRPLHCGSVSCLADTQAYPRSPATQQSTPRTGSSSSSCQPSRLSNGVVASHAPFMAYLLGAALHIQLYFSVAAAFAARPYSALSRIQPTSLMAQLATITNASGIVCSHCGWVSSNLLPRDHGHTRVLVRGSQSPSIHFHAFYTTFQLIYNVRDASSHAYSLEQPSVVSPSLTWAVASSVASNQR